MLFRILVAGLKGRAARYIGCHAARDCLCRRYASIARFDTSSFRRSPRKTRSFIVVSRKRLASRASKSRRSVRENPRQSARNARPGWVAVHSLQHNRLKATLFLMKRALADVALFNPFSDRSVICGGVCRSSRRPLGAGTSDGPGAPPRWAIRRKRVPGSLRSSGGIP